ncbi:MAG: DUF4920 domain-containing protein [Pseudomonadota bacterium]|nr:DUF4920 domain-containing protein [Pseudomonadota bacterium]
MRKSLFVLLLSLSSLAFASEPKTYGDALPEATAVPISVAAADADAYVGKANRFSGRITEVCQKEGCWMMLEDDGEVARVMMHDHAFTIPKDATGRAQVHGVLSVKELSKEAAEHLAEDGNGVVPPTRELRIDATGVRIEG